MPLIVSFLAMPKSKAQTDCPAACVPPKPMTLSCPSSLPAILCSAKSTEGERLCLPSWRHRKGEIENAYAGIDIQLP
ncbi:hypothetical protein BDV10DRAFT_41050 [Aspergillus recurvatus]